jgi:hypothetical protein
VALLLMGLPKIVFTLVIWFSLGAQPVYPALSLCSDAVAIATHPPRLISGRFSGDKFDQSYFR